MKILVTGANGFVGRALCQDFERRCHVVIRAVRVANADNEVAVGDIGPETDWSPVLGRPPSAYGFAPEVDAIVHLAAHVHKMPGRWNRSAPEFRQLNTLGTLNLARQAVTAGVRRFIFLSSIKVNGAASRPGAPFRADDPPAPEDAYAISKYEAEQGLLALARETGLEVVIIRPPLVYGPGVKGNFRTLLDWAARPWPLPLGAIRNRRSYVALDNLVDLIVTCLDHPAVANQVFLVSDDEDVSTPILLALAGRALGRRVRLWPVPVTALTLAASLLGRRAWTDRLCGNLQADIVKTRALLGWRPPIGLDEGLRRTVGGPR